MKTILSLSVSGTLLLLLLGLKQFYQNRFSRRWQYYIRAGQLTDSLSTESMTLSACEVRVDIIG